ncbi:hypothetical protein CL617_05515 [archaeon]|nr:hypothetical protein [archaeon]|tara:strand:- start:451 stop:897 length:447 start_codon:yes stop_codon:yes gene_type:complete
MKPNYFTPSFTGLIEIEDIQKKEEEDKKNKKENLEYIIQDTKKEDYISRTLEYSERPKYGLNFYLPPGINLNFKWFRFGSPQGLAYMTMPNIEMDRDLLWKGSFGDFVGVHEVGHKMKNKGYDEDFNTLSSAYDFQLYTGSNYTYLPK